jgi:hypothetical protein
MTTFINDPKASEIANAIVVCLPPPRLFGFELIGRLFFEKKENISQIAACAFPQPEVYEGSQFLVCFYFHFFKI